MVGLKDIAAAAGVSVATASMVLNHAKGAERISEACAKRVRKTADQMGYVANARARSMRTGCTEVIGLVMEHGAGPGEYATSVDAVPYFDHLSAGIETAAHRRDHNLIRIRPGKGMTALERGFRGSREGRWDGLVVPGITSALNRTTLVHGSKGVPMVVVEGEPCGSIPYVGLDDLAGVALIVEHLVELGHRRLLWFGADGGAPSAWQARREQVFITGVWDAKLRGASCRYPPERGIDAAAQADREMTAYLKDHDDFTAVVCSNDVTAVGAMRALTRHGRRIPEDVSVTGFDDVFGLVSPVPLTSVSHLFHELGRRSGDLLLDMVLGGSQEQKRLEGHREHLKPTLSVRESTGPAKE